VWWWLAACEAPPSSSPIVRFEGGQVPVERAPDHPFEARCAGIWPADACAAGGCLEPGREATYGPQIGEVLGESGWLRELVCDETDCAVSVTLDLSWVRVVKTYAGPVPADPDWYTLLALHVLPDEAGWVLASEQDVLEVVEECAELREEEYEVETTFDVSTGWCTPELVSPYTASGWRILRFLFPDQRGSDMYADVVSGEMTCIPPTVPPASED
jgi:hypothetical protein